MLVMIQVFVDEHAPLANLLALFDVGLEVVFPSSGRLGVRGASGHAFRWGEGWLGPIRDDLACSQVF